MLPLDVVVALSAQFPRQREELKARAGNYNQVLAPLAGERLARAFDTTMAGWVKASAPWPKEIADNAPSTETAAADQVAKTERAHIIARKLIENTLAWLNLEIKARAMDLQCGSNSGEYGQALKVEIEPIAWSIAKSTVKAGTHPPSRLQVLDVNWRNADERVLSWARIGKGRAGSFKPMRTAARQAVDATPAPADTEAAA